MSSITSITSGRLSPTRLTGDQQDAISHMIAYNHSIIIAPTGAGKTVMTLTAIQEINDMPEEEPLRVLVACPAKVRDSWVADAKKWSHLSELKVVQITKGDELDTLRRADFDVLVVSHNMLDVTLTQSKRLALNGLVIDELSKATGKSAKRAYNKENSERLFWRVGLTATPVSQDYQKLFGMCRVIDCGATFGKSKQRFLSTYFYSDYMGYNWTIKDGAAEQIHARISDLFHIMPDKKEEQLPPISHATVSFVMGDAATAAFKEMKKEFCSGEIEAPNAAVRDAKLRQLASGFAYTEDDVIDFDMDRAVTVVDQISARPGKKVVVFYEYTRQAQQLEYILSDRLISFVTVRGGMTPNGLREVLDEFKHGSATVLIAQIAAMSHGVDGLQRCSSTAIFMQPVWSNDATQQAIGRLWRTGQTEPVEIITVEAVASLDSKVSARVDDRKVFMSMFSAALEGK